MASEIGRKGILHRVGKAFNILDVKQAPALLNTDIVSCVIPLPFGAEETGRAALWAYGPYNSPATNTNVRMAIVANVDSIDQPNANQFFRATDGDWRIDAISVTVNFDGAGASVFDGERINAGLYFYPASRTTPGIGASSPRFYIYLSDPAFIVQLDKTSYELAIPASYSRTTGGSTIPVGAGSWSGLVRSSQRIPWFLPAAASPTEIDNIGLGIELWPGLGFPGSGATWPDNTTFGLKVLGRRVAADDSGAVPGI